jgi:hypothetical protein
MDDVRLLPNGRRGADVIQMFRGDTYADVVTSILWESKRSQTWNDEWLTKIREDQRRACANTAVIVAASLPKGSARIDQRDGVWLCDLASVTELGLVLRESLLAQAHVQLAIDQRQDVAGEVHDYVTGRSFVEHVKAVLEAQARMRTQIGSERAAMERLWTRHEQAIDTTVSHMARLVGDLDGRGVLITVPRALLMDSESRVARRRGLAKSRLVGAELPGLVSGSD